MLFNTAVERVERSPAGKVLHTATEGRPQTHAVDEILVGAGRAPNVEDLGLDRVGVKFDTRAGVARQRPPADGQRAHLRGRRRLPEHKFTHTADASARIVIQNALFWGRKRLSALTIPWCTYTDPEIAHVGLYERDAKEQGIEVATFQVPHGGSGPRRSRRRDGRIREDPRAQRHGQNLGATIVARHAGEMISEITLAMAAGSAWGHRRRDPSLSDPSRRDQARGRCVQPRPVDAVLEGRLRKTHGLATVSSRRGPGEP